MGATRWMFLVLFLYGLGTFFYNLKQLVEIEGAICAAAEVKDCSEVTILDKRFTYTADEARTLLEKIGPAGRSAYLEGLSEVDAWKYPVAYMMLFIGIYGLIVGHRWRRFWWLFLPPVIAAGSDIMIENPRHIDMINTFGSSIETLYDGGPTTLKMFSFMTAVIFIALSVVLLILSRRREKHAA